MDLNDKLGFLSEGSCLTIEQHDCFMAEGLKRKNQSFLPIPSGAIDPSQGCDPLLLIHANQMPPICGADWSTTPLNSGSSQSEVPITGFTSPLGFFFFKNIMTADFLPALPLLSQGRLSDGFLISTKAEAACFHTYKTVTLNIFLPHLLGDGREGCWLRPVFPGIHSDSGNRF